jgi:hypothetical protein
MSKWPDPAEGKIIIWLPFWIYWAASGGLTLLLGVWGVWILHPNWLFPPPKVTKDGEVEQQDQGKKAVTARRSPSDIV